ncbi:recombination regulator RecX [Siminovitchia fortis]|uniref:Regulatory protein RecX n=2 Tax=Siminovitchia fortis TaxID=254758 RepID=A0A443IU38_9BACI|nr:recombination regulator RecX [Siminovitchia fortis]RWR11215.1 recombination regulator RecX [Siminovitchia fortis]WHY80369.1 recombination regulator RecX [Siminovitchia fortis]
MPVITKIAVQKKNQSRYNIFLDHVYAFAVDEDILIKYQLTKGKELSEQDLTRVQHEDEIRKAYHSAIQFLSYRMRSALEIRAHLQKKEWPDSIIDVVLQELTIQKYIDDLEFAKAYVRTYANSGKKGPLVLRRELANKGVPEIKINEALAEYNKEKQVADAIRLGNKYAAQNKKLSERMLKQKLEYTLSTKGFPPEIILAAMDGINYEKDESLEWETLKAEAEKMKRRYKKYTGYEYRRRMQQALFRKGFTIELINRFMDEDAEEG